MGDYTHVSVIVATLNLGFSGPHAKGRFRSVFTFHNDPASHVSEASDIASILRTSKPAAFYAVVYMLIQVCGDQGFKSRPGLFR